MRDVLARHDQLFIDVARSLTIEDWGRPSLCTGWSNKDVLAHLLVGFELPIGKLFARMASHRGSFDQANDDLTRARSSQREPAELLDDLDWHHRRPRRPRRPVLPSRLLLGDHVVHHLDIVLPLGIDPIIPEDAARAVLSTEVAIPNPFVPARKHAAGLSLEATDIEWRRVLDKGPKVSGHAAHMISVLAGRPHAIAHLDGDGVELLRERVDPSER